MLPDHNTPAGRVAANGLNPCSNGMLPDLLMRSRSAILSSSATTELSLKSLPRLQLR